MEPVMAYCVKEKAQKPMKDAQQVTLKNGKQAMSGVCSSCGTKMMKFVSAKKGAPAPAKAPAAPAPVMPAPAAVPVPAPSKEPAMSMATPATPAPMTPKA